MSINESGLKRVNNKKTQLTKKLITARTNREKEWNKIQRIQKKKSPTRTDLSSLSRSQKAYHDYEKEITNLMEELDKNEKEILKYQGRVDKERNKKQDKLFNTLNNSSLQQKHSMNNSKQIDYLQDKVEELSEEVRKATNNKEIRYDVFISHSNKDKEEVVTELSTFLINKGLRVFEDVRELEIGDSTTGKINNAILNSKFAIVVISENFFESGWSHYEFTSFLKMHIEEKSVVLLPIWHNVSYEQVREYNPYLTDLHALETSKFSINQISDSIYRVIEKSQS